MLHAPPGARTFTLITRTDVWRRLLNDISISRGPTFSLTVEEKKIANLLNTYFTNRHLQVFLLKIKLSLSVDLNAITELRGVKYHFIRFNVVSLSPKLSYF